MANWGNIKSKGVVQDRRGVSEVITEKRSSIGKALPALGRPLRKSTRTAVLIGNQPVGSLGRK